MLREAGQRFLSQPLVQLDILHGDARERLRGLIEQLILLALHQPVPWHGRLMLQEMIAPTPMLPVLLQQGIRPGMEHLQRLLGEVLGLAPGHPAVQRAAALAIGPCITLLQTGHTNGEQLLPAIRSMPQQTAQDMAAYALAGLDALAARYR